MTSKAEIKAFLIDVEFMVREEVQYMRTGQHNGRPMRDVLGQWHALARAAKKLLEELDRNEAPL